MGRVLTIISAMPISKLEQNTSHSPLDQTISFLLLSFTPSQPNPPPHSTLNTHHPNHNPNNSTVATAPLALSPHPPTVSASPAIPFPFSPSSPFPSVLAQAASCRHLHTGSS
ncbi:hypothetical protein NX059_007536 [Plenodomus lindquistii]|nr:hypothetical protein NX059_007536 [Plenodomus lindquistii]